MNKKLKIFLGTILILIVSGASGFYLFAYLAFTAWTADVYTEYKGEEAKLKFEEISEISDTSLTDIHFLAENRSIDPEFYFRFRTDKEIIEKLIEKNELQIQIITSTECQKLLNYDVRQRAIDNNLQLSWWNPKSLQVNTCYYGINSDNDGYYLIYEPSSGNTFLYIQTT
ncbi:MAG: hypothetical protein AAFQ91_02170 [Cyanobacteria bacterium J06621_15]